MKTVKELADFTQERINVCTEQLAHKYKHSVRTLYAATEHGKPELIGSCVAFTHLNKKFLITCSHVINNFHDAKSEIYLGGVTNIFPISDNWLMTSTSEGEEDIYDIAILELTKEDILSAGKIKYLSKADVLTQLSNNEIYCLALGYPITRNKKLIQNNHVIEEPLPYSSSLLTNPDLFRKLQLSQSNHYILDFKKKLRDKDGLKVKAFKPNGMSGGGLFLIERMANIESYFSPTSGCSGKLIGILHTHKKKEECLISTNFNFVIKAIEEHFIVEK